MRRIVILIVILLITALFLIMKNKVLTKTLSVGNIKLQIEIADSLTKQVQGLSGRDSLCENCGMLFVYDRPDFRSFWMRGMKFPLDLIFIRDGRIAEIVPNVPTPMPGQDIPLVHSQSAADAVLEVNAGLSFRNHLQIGDLVQESK